jgi:hypothetical protein
MAIKSLSTYRTDSPHRGNGPILQQHPAVRFNGNGTDSLLQSARFIYRSGKGRGKVIPVLN